MSQCQITVKNKNGETASEETNSTFSQFESFQYLNDYMLVFLVNIRDESLGTGIVEKILNILG